MKSRLGKIIAVLVVTVGSMVGFTTAASASHYQGGEYSYCAYPSNAAYDGVYVSAYGLGSDAPNLNKYVAGRAFVGVEKDNKCYRRGAVYHVLRVQIDRIAVRVDGRNLGLKGPFNIGKTYVFGQTSAVSIPCNKYAQTGLRYTIRYTNNATVQGSLNSAGYLRCRS